MQKRKRAPVKDDFHPPPPFPLHIAMPKQPEDTLNLLVPASVFHLVPDASKDPDFDDRGRRRQCKIPTPEAFKKISRQLRGLRQDGVWVYGTRDEQVEQMNEWFPDMTPAPAPQKAPQKVVRCSPPTVLPSKECPDSNIGILQKLPGELRNRVYRLAILRGDGEEDKEGVAKAVMGSGTCSQGICLHSKVGYNVPGIANTCRQLRWEVMPIFCAENKTFQFDDGMVHQCCVGNFLRSIGDYADMIKEFRFALKRPSWNMDTFLGWTTYTFTLVTPKASISGGLKLVQHEKSAQLVCQCPLDRVITDLNKHMNEKGVPVGHKAMQFADSEEFADFVWRMRKSKQWPQWLGKCKTCAMVTFNN